MPYTLEWIRTVSGDQNARFVSSDTKVVSVSLNSETPVIPAQILEVHGQYLVLPKSKADSWLMGTRREDGCIYCWGDYGDLRSTLEGL